MSIHSAVEPIPAHATQPLPLSSAALIGSKLLVLEGDPTQRRALEHFCRANNLLAVPEPQGSVTAFLRSNADLGGVLLSEDYGGSKLAWAAAAREIGALRPELPVILRRDRSAGMDDLADDLKRVCRAAYKTCDLAALARAVERHILTLRYPEALVHGITEISQRVLASEFCGFQIEAQTPTVVHDRVFFGGLFSLIPLESGWCRGYLMLQTDESRMLQLLDHSGVDGAGTDLRSLNDRLREATNLIWGLFKNRYVGDRTVRADSNVQVPLVFNLEDRCISFGASNTHVCFPYRLKDETRGLSIDLQERFVFNLNWAPDDFHEIAPPPDSGVGSGSLEFF